MLKSIGKEMGLGERGRRVLERQRIRFDNGARIRSARLLQNVTYIHVQTWNKLHKCYILKPTRFARYSYSCPRCPDMLTQARSRSRSRYLSILPLRLSG